VRFVFWTESFPPDIGGLERRLSMMAQTLWEAGHEVVVVVLSNPERPPLPYRVVPFVDGDAIIASLHFVNELLEQPALLYISRVFQRDPEHHLRTLAGLGRSRTTILRIPTTQVARLLVKKGWWRLLAGRVHRIHALNQASRDSLQALTGSFEIHQFGNATSPHIPYTPTYGPRAMFAGRLTPSKNLHGLLLAWQLLGDANLIGERELTVCGPVSSPAYAERCLAVMSSLANVQYCGVYDSGSTSELQTASVLIVPSFREGHSNLVSEALAAGALVVGSDIPGIVEHIGNGRGLLIHRPLNARSIAQALQAAFMLDEASYHAIVERGRQYAEQSLFHDQEATALVALAEAVD
jgi:glycosyltransferase involved in cell wall biosynthesis